MSISFASLNHPLRVSLAAEVHSRPFLRLNAPENITHLAVYVDKVFGQDISRGGDPQYETLTALCTYFGASAPSPEAKYFYYDFGRFRLKWERHAEFTTYTFAERHENPRGLTVSFKYMPLRNLPQEWLASLRGKVMVAAHVVLDNLLDSSNDLHGSMRPTFEGNLLAGSRVLQGGEVWTDFLVQSDGFSRFVVRDVDLQEQQAGRLVQRLLEIETYRMMALLGLPHAQRATPVLNEIEGELAKLAAVMVTTDRANGNSVSTADDEHTLLSIITGLAARIEDLSLYNSYRFSASQAYFSLVHARIEELRETRIEGTPTIGEFMDRRLTPAMNTCQAVAHRQAAVADRIAHINDLLRTRVGIVQECQNRLILESMNKRAAQQLRLQQAVEGLSVVAISYYMIGLITYAGKAAKSIGVLIDPDIISGTLVPFVAGGVWLGLRRLHKRLNAH